MPVAGCTSDRSLAARLGAAAVVVGTLTGGGGLSHAAGAGELSSAAFAARLRLHQPHRRVLQRRDSDGIPSGSPALFAGGDDLPRRDSSSIGSSSLRASVSSSSSSATTPGDSDSAFVAAVAAAEILNQRNIRAQETEYASAQFEGQANCRATIEAFVSLVAPKGGGNWDPLLGAFNGAHESESDFDLSVFWAMGGRCVGDWTRKEEASPYRPAGISADNRAIVLEPKRRASAVVDGEPMEYATGLARRVALPSDPSCILTSSAPAMADHAWVVFRRPVGSGAREPEWKVWIALAAVDFTRGAAVCEGISRNPRGNVDDKSLSPLQAARHGPLARAVGFTAAHVLRGLAALGELPSRVPFAAVACKRDAYIANGWIHGNLVVPKACGCRFAFNVDACGTVRGDRGENYQALAAYLHVMTHGLAAAQRWLERLADAPQGSALPAPHWISGQELHFGTGMPLPNVRLVATPVLNYGAHGFRISQGELFEGAVNLCQLRSGRTIQDRVFWCLDTYDSKEQSVLIKVSSTACFNLLIPNRGGYLYSLTITKAVWDQSSTVRNALAPSLYGVFLTKDRCGLVQLLPNLTDLGYTPLFPQDWLERGGWEALWKAFAGIVKEALIPLATAEIVHADIRVGYDETFNILYNPTTASMRLIDLDSLCAFEVLVELPAVNDLRNIDPDDLPPKMQTPLGFVLGQVICFGEVWLRKAGHAVVDANKVIQEAVQSGHDVFDAVADEVSVSVVDAELIRHVLIHYRNRLEVTYSSDGNGSTSPD